MLVSGQAQRWERDVDLCDGGKVGSLSAGGQQHQVSHLFWRLEKVRKSTNFSFVGIVACWVRYLYIYQTEKGTVTVGSSVVDSDSMGSLDLYPDPQSVSRSRRAKMTHKSARCCLLRAEGFSCCLSVLYGGLGISKLPFLMKKKILHFSAVFFSSFFFTWNAGSGSDSGLIEMLLSKKKAFWFSFLASFRSHCVYIIR